MSDISLDKNLIRWWSHTQIELHMVKVTLLTEKKNSSMFILHIHCIVHYYITAIYCLLFGHLIECCVLCYVFIELPLNLKCPSQFHCLPLLLRSHLCEMKAIFLYICSLYVYCWLFIFPVYCIYWHFDVILAVSQPYAACFRLFTHLYVSA